MMLEYIKIKNINAIGECEIDFSKDKYRYLEDNVIGNFVNPLAIYGYNGSGKSSLLKAVGYLICLMNNPVDNLEPFIVNQFLFERYNDEPKEEYINGSMELHFTSDGNYFEYFISISRKKFITQEYLKGKSIVFNRDEENEVYKNKSIKISDLRSKLIPSIRYLAAEKINDYRIQSAFKFLSSLTFVELPLQMSGQPFVYSKHFNNLSRADLMVSKSQDVKDILIKYHEFPIYDVIKKETTDVNSPSGYYLKFENQDGLIPFEFMSSGMFSQSTLLSILVSLPENSVLFIDEIEMSLHTTAILSFLNIVKEKKIQLVFSSHDTHILQTLRPDQIYLAKWKKGISSFYKLSKIYPNIREINNIEKMYLAAIFDDAIDVGC